MEGNLPHVDDHIIYILVLQCTLYYLLCFKVCAALEYKQNRWTNVTVAVDNNFNDYYNKAKR